MATGFLITTVRQRSFKLALLESEKSSLARHIFTNSSHSPWYKNIIFQCVNDGFFHAQVPFFCSEFRPYNLEANSSDLSVTKKDLSPDYLNQIGLENVRSSNSGT